MASYRFIGQMNDFYNTKVVYISIGAQGISGKIPDKENITTISSMSFRKQKHFSGGFTTFKDGVQ